MKLTKGEFTPHLTADRWAMLSDKAKWDIKVALRGPDARGSASLKYYTSAVIRGECRGVFRVGGMVNTLLRCILLPTTWQRAERVAPPNFAFDGHHFFEHQLEAANWLSIPSVMLTDEDWDGLVSSIAPAWGRLKKIPRAYGIYPDTPTGVAFMNAGIAIGRPEEVLWPEQG